MIDFYSFSKDSLAELLVQEFGEKSFRAQQLFDWVYKRGVHNAHEMTNISKSFRMLIEQKFFFPKLKVLTKRVSKLDGSVKYLLESHKGEKIESVLINQPNRKTLCISSQVGCAMGCTFCQTGTMGLSRNLECSEIVGQVLAVVTDFYSSQSEEERKQNSELPFTNVVYMGMGEPLHNYKNVISSLSILTDPHALAIPPKKITVSTSGLVPAIKKFGIDTKANLAVSLNATTDQIRADIMPVNKKYPLKVLLQCLKEYPLQRKKKITLEYVMLSEVNDTVDDLHRLPKLLKGIQGKVNLIPYNNNAGLGFTSPPKERVLQWHKHLTEKNIDVTIRWSKGRDINAACGQLVTESSRKNTAVKKQLLIFEEFLSSRLSYSLKVFHYNGLRTSSKSLN